MPLGPTTSLIAKLATVGTLCGLCARLVNDKTEKNFCDKIFIWSVCFACLRIGIPSFGKASSDLGKDVLQLLGDNPLQNQNQQVVLNARGQQVVQGERFHQVLLNEQGFRGRPGGRRIQRLGQEIGPPAQIQPQNRQRLNNRQNGQLWRKNPTARVAQRRANQLQIAPPNPGGGGLGVVVLADSLRRRSFVDLTSSEKAQEVQRKVEADREFWEELSYFEFDV